MAKLYKQLQEALTSYEDKPVRFITKQNIDEGLYTVRGKDGGMPAWFYIIVHVSKIADLTAQSSGTTINVTKFGPLVEYIDKRGKTRPALGWGTDPPKMFQTWISEKYGRASVDENINLIYEQDDIRLCTMQRAVPQQLLGVRFYRYDAQERFYYIELTKDLPFSLALRAGIRNYDRIICFNGVNIENDSYNQFVERTKSERNLPVQMLVCSPATYAHYKQNNKLIHCDLRTVQHLKPVYATSTSNSNTDTPPISFKNEIFCAIQSEYSDFIDIIPQAAVFKSPEFTRVNDICFVERKEQYQKGKVLFIGSYNDCQKFAEFSMNQIVDVPIGSITDCIDLRSISLTDNVAIHATLEQLPNELFFYLFNYLNIQHLYNAFWGLNARLNTLFQSYQNLSLTFDEKTDELSMKSYAPYITRLIVDTSKNCDFTLFPNLQTLILCDGNSKHLKQIQPNIIPNLTHLSFFLGSEFILSSGLVNDVFSNRFPLLRHANLSRVNNLTTGIWSTSPSLRFLSIRCDEPLIVSCILASCPNLDHLRLHVFKTIHTDTISSPSTNHPLRRLTLWSDSVELTSTNIDTILDNTPNIEHFYLQTTCCVPFTNLADGLLNRLDRLFRFDCHVKEMMDKYSRIGDVEAIHQLHPCFNRIKCIEEQDDFRVFATE